MRILSTPQGAKYGVKKDEGLYRNLHSKEEGEKERENERTRKRESSEKNPERGREEQKRERERKWCRDREKNT